jgi:uncharacterized protein YbgA (DUF1722 family)
VRIWDVNPGYLNRQSLLGEHRELHAIVSIIRNNKKGYSRHPETLRWQGFGWALNQRHKLLAAEMNLRGYTDRTPVKLKSKSLKWPEVFVDIPAVQFNILVRKYKNTGQGRIPLPKNVQQLWAQHKYSVMARDIAEYKYLGGWVASRKTDSAIFDLYPELVSLLRCPPAEGNLRNAVQHMWGYVSPYVSHHGNNYTNLQSKVYRGGKEEATQAYSTIRRGADDAANKGRRMTGSASRRGAHNKSIIYLAGNYHLQGGNLHANWYLKEIQRLVFLHDIVYLKESTALSELQAWIH